MKTEKHFDIFVKQELKSIVGNSWRNFWILAAVFSVTIFALELSRSGVKFLSYKMSDPFINWIDVKEQTNFEAFMEEIEQSKNAFNISTIEANHYILEYVFTKDYGMKRVDGDYALSDALSLQPGVLFYSAGYVNKENDGGDKYKETYTLNYIQIPINFQYKLDMGGINAFVQAGPYLGCAISGKYKWKITEDGNSRSGNESLKFGFDKEEDDYKPFDFGLGLGVGLQFNNIQIGLGYNIGLANMSLYDKSSVKNNGIVLTVSYFFGK